MFMIRLNFFFRSRTAIPPKIRKSRKRQRNNKQTIFPSAEENYYFSFRENHAYNGSVRFSKQGSVSRIREAWILIKLLVGMCCWITTAIKPLALSVIRDVDTLFQPPKRQEVFNVENLSLLVTYNVISVTHRNPEALHTCERRNFAKETNL